MSPDFKLDAQYLRHVFSFSPGPFGRLFQVFLGAVFGSCLLCGLVSWIAFSLTKDKDGRIWSRLWRRLFHFGVTTGSFGLVFLFFARQEVRVLGARFWFLLWLAWASAWMIFILRHAFVRVPREMQEREERQRIGKYLSKRK